MSQVWLVCAQLKFRRITLAYEPASSDKDDANRQRTRLQIRTLPDRLLLLAPVYIALVGNYIHS